MSALFRLGTSVGATGLVCACLHLLSGCEMGQASGFALPPGDAELGKATFVELGCHACHEVNDSVPRMAGTPHPDIFVRLGGQTTRVKSYGDLVTSIIHPSHQRSRGMDPRTVTEQGSSRMPNGNERMTVTQLVNLTTFLSDQYDVWTPRYVPIQYF